jgi:2-polyprenyl-6-methoxyphenol hydroxylase-like FAD-dependent oxidoreductase
VIDVVIAGAGPDGLMVAGELGLAGIRPVVLDPMPGPNPAPRVNRIVGQAARILDHRDLYSALTGTTEPPTPALYAKLRWLSLRSRVGSPAPKCSQSLFNNEGLFRCLPTEQANTTRTFVGVMP